MSLGMRALAVVARIAMLFLVFSQFAYGAGGCRSLECTTEYASPTPCAAQARIAPAEDLSWVPETPHPSAGDTQTWTVDRWPKVIDLIVPTIRTAPRNSSLTILQCSFQL